MSTWMKILICIAIGYALGNILFAVIIAKIKGINLFESGSGNPGMANTGRVLGKKMAALVLLGDILKTMLAIGICWKFFPLPDHMEILYAGLGTVLGHDFPIWHHFDGGKGVTCICTTIILYAPIPGILSCLVGLVIVLVKKDLKLGACVIAMLFALSMAIFGPLQAAGVSNILAILMLIKNAPPNRINKTKEETVRIEDNSNLKANAEEKESESNLIQTSESEKKKTKTH